ncbi:hypothetical protein [Streptomyces sp. NPDC006368]|uniref:hypothetical protein n=1 Tax=Streptomyces sp. NPDC006368 TaxID=3156760 RepID=UPI0033A2FA3E
MDVEKRQQRAAPAPHEGGEGCLTTVIRIPVRIVVLLLVVPVRMIRDVLVLCGSVLRRLVLRPLDRALGRVWDTVLAPVGRAVAWCAERLVRYAVVAPCSWLYRWVLAPVGRGTARLAGGVATVIGTVIRGIAAALVWTVSTLVVTPALRLYRVVLAPLGRGVGWTLWALLVRPWTALFRWVMTPLGHGLVWLFAHTLVPFGRGLVLLGKVLIVVPAVFVYRWILTPVGRGLAAAGREIVAAFAVAWRVAGYLSRAVGRALKWLARNLVGRPASWFHRNVCTPVGHAVRDHLWRPVREAAVEAGRSARAALGSVRETVRKARRDAWRALVGGARMDRPLEPVAAPARTLGSTTTAPGAAPAPEISPRKRG